MKILHRTTIFLLVNLHRILKPCILDTNLRVCILLLCESNGMRSGTKLTLQTNGTTPGSSRWLDEGEEEEAAYQVMNER